MSSLNASLNHNWISSLSSNHLSLEQISDLPNCQFLAIATNWCLCEILRLKHSDFTGECGFSWKTLKAFEMVDGIGHL